MRAGYDPDAFWRQTPASFAATMKAHAARAADDIESRYFQAWATERFAREKKLHAFSRYANDLKPKKRASADDLKMFFRGARKVGRKELANLRRSAPSEDVAGGGITIKRRKRRKRSAG